MNKDDLRAAFALLRALHPRAHQFADKNVMLAWGEALEDYSYDMFRELAFEQAVSLDRPPELRDIIRALDQRNQHNLDFFLYEWLPRELTEEMVQDALRTLDQPEPPADALENLRTGATPIWRIVARLLRHPKYPNIQALSKKILPLIDPPESAEVPEPPEPIDPPEPIEPPEPIDPRKEDPQ